MATSIDKSVNWRDAAATPDYQVTAQRVDTFVQGERNTKGMQVAAALESAAGTVSQVGKEKLKQKRIKQRATLETLEARLQAQRNEDPTYNFEDDTEYKGLLEEHRIYIANALGKNTKSVFDADGNVVTYEQIRDHLNSAENSYKYDDPNELENYLNSFSVPIDEENDGANIHLQAAQANAYEMFKDKIKGEGVLKRKENEARQLEESFKSNVQEALNGGGTPQEIWDNIYAVDQGVRMDKTVKSMLIQEAVTEFALETKNETLLLESNIPYDIYKKPAYVYTNRRIADQLESDAQSEARFREFMKGVEKEQAQDEQMQLIYENMQQGISIDTTQITDPVVFNFAKQMQAQGILDTNVSETNYITTMPQIKDALFSGSPLVWKGKTYEASEKGISQYLMARGGLNQKEMSRAIAEIPAIVEGASVTKLDWYEGYVSTVVENEFKKGLYVLDDEVAGLLDDAQNRIRNDVAELYVRYKADGVFSPTERNQLRDYAKQEAAMLRDLANEGVDLDKVNTDTVTKEENDLDTVLNNLLGESEQEEAVVSDKVEDQPEKPKSDMTPAEMFVNLPEKDLIEALVQTPSLSFEQVDGLTPAEMLEAYPEEIDKVLEQLQVNKKFRNMLKGVFGKEDKPEGLTPAQQAYFDKTGKLPASAQTK
jgi:hypothetical protein